MFNLVGNKVVLRRLIAEDSAFIFKLLNTESWIRYIGDRQIASLEDAQKYIVNGPQQAYQKFGYGLYCVELIANGEAIGICGIINRDSLALADLGIALLPDYEGKGYAKEACILALQEAKTVYHHSQICAIVVPENKNCIILLNKLGFEFCKTMQLPEDQTELAYYQLNLNSI